MALALALASALVYGAADFVGGIAARKQPAIAVALVSAAVGLVVFSLLGLIVGGAPSAAALAWGAASGVAGMTAAACLYASLAIGPMTLVAPLTATISGLTPVIWSVIAGEQLDAPTWWGMGLVLLGAALISLIPGKRSAGSPSRAAGLAVIAGLLFGGFYIFLAQSPPDSGMFSLVANRATGLVLLAGVLVALVSRRGSRFRPSPTGLRPALVVGVLDALANVLYVCAVRDGVLAVTTVLISLYPVGTIALSAAVLQERIAPAQWIGVIVALVGIAALAL